MGTKGRFLLDRSAHLQVQPPRSCQRGVLHLPLPPADRPGNRAPKSFAVPAPAPHALCRTSSLRTRTVSARNEGHPPLASVCKLSLLIVPGPGQAGAGGRGSQAGAPARSPWAMPEGSHLHSAGNASFGLRPVPVLAPSVWIQDCRHLSCLQNRKSRGYKITPSPRSQVTSPGARTITFSLAKWVSNDAFLYEHFEVMCVLFVLNHFKHL